MSFPLRDPTTAEMEVINRQLFAADAKSVCRSMDLCFEYNEWVRCGPCFLALDATTRAKDTRP